MGLPFLPLSYRTIPSPNHMKQPSTCLPLEEPLHLKATIEILGWPCRGRLEGVFEALNSQSAGVVADCLIVFLVVLRKRSSSCEGAPTCGELSTQVMNEMGGEPSVSHKA